MTKSIPGITWRGAAVDDTEILRELPAPLNCLLSEVNGFILHHGALHVRGASLAPEWHSLRAAWRGPNAFHLLYESVQGTDVPFAQDQCGDQFLMRDGRVLRLAGESGEIDDIADDLDEFFQKVSQDIEGFLNVGLGHVLQPGQLLCAYPPFVCKESGAGAMLMPTRAEEVISFHAEFAKQIREVPDGGQITIRVANDNNDVN